MPDPQRRAARKAESIRPSASRSSSEPLNLATASTPDVLTSLLSLLGLDDPLGVGEGSEAAEVPVSDRRYAELLKRFGGGGNLRDQIGQVFTPSNPQSGVPKRVRLTSVDPQGGKAITHALDQGYTQLDATPGDILKLIREGHLVPEGPPERTVPQLLRRLRKVMK